MKQTPRKKEALCCLFDAASQSTRVNSSCNIIRGDNNKNKIKINIGLSKSKK